jgi:hypothetical protein
MRLVIYTPFLKYSIKRIISQEAQIPTHQKGFGVRLLSWEL